MPTLSDQLRAAALEARQRAQEAAADEQAARERREKYEHVSALLESQAAALDDTQLTTGHIHATVSDEMQAETRSQRVSKARLRDTNRRHPFVRALVAKGLTVSEYAKELGVARTVLQSWYDSRPDNSRPIPKSVAETIEKQLGVPLSSWRRITSDK